jgi:trk system potassium uptake protein TrkH
VIQAVSVLLAILGAAMLLPAIVDFVAGNPDWQAFLASSLFVLFFSSLFFISGNRPDQRVSRRSVFAFVSVIWLLFSLAAALPFYFSGLNVSFVDAFFESVSGLTTTGSTVLTGLDGMPPGILLWRSLTQWIGGLGIIVLGITILPFMRSGGQQLFSLESSDTSDKPFPRAAQYTERIGLIYLLVTIACATAYMIFGMTPFEAINHAMTTVSTGGYSTSDSSMGHFGTIPMLAASTVFMFIGGLPFLFLIRLSIGAFERDIQINYYVATILFATILILGCRVLNGASPDLGDLVVVMFNVVSVVTTTGYASEDYLLWGSAAVMIFFIITFVGACAGSTAGGIKQFRFVILHRAVSEYLGSAFRPHRVISKKYGTRRIDDQISSSVLVFSFLYAMTFLFCACVFSMFGLDLETAASASATALANVGPGIGNMIGPAGNFATLPDTVKWILSAEMLIGRLEIMCVYALLLPAFWRT